MVKSVVVPIGYAKNKVEIPQVGGWAGVASEIVLKKKFAQGLDGIEEFSHVLVVYWMDKVRGFSLKHRPQGNLKVPKVGIFACRCPNRPNPIGITTAKLVSRKENVLKVVGLDVINKTPILDIKPYTRNYDTAKNARYPRWVDKLRY